MAQNLIREPYEIISIKLELADLTVELMTIAREKWKLHEALKIVLLEEEDMQKKINGKTDELHAMIKKLGDGQK